MRCEEVSFDRLRMTVRSEEVRSEEVRSEKVRSEEVRSVLRQAQDDVKSEK